MAENDTESLADEWGAALAEQGAGGDNPEEMAAEWAAMLNGGGIAAQPAAISSGFSPCSASAAPHSAAMSRSSSAIALPIAAGVL